MITRMDRDIGRVLDLLRELGADKNTLIIFSSDNGPHNESGRDLKFFNSSGPLTGLKRSMYEGGIRVPTIAWWPGTVKAGDTSDHITYFGDFYATVCDLIGEKPPTGLDSISFLPTLTGKSRQKKHDYLYWEFYEQGSRQAVRFGNWKVIREPILTGEMWKTLREPKMIGRAKLFNLATDLREVKDLAAEKPKILKRGIHYMNLAHVIDPRWEIKPAGPNEIP
jgi:arylsulfatase A-like enzyme